jgi:hypothetical protein
MTKYYIDINNNYLGGFDGVAPPTGATEVSSAPDDARQKWNGSSWDFIVLSPEERLSVISTTTQKFLDNSAKTYGYDSIASAVTYADEPSVLKFQSEGQAFRVWRSLVWDKCYKILSDWEAGTVPEPSPEEVIAQLPTLVI